MNRSIPRYQKSICYRGTHGILYTLDVWYSHGFGCYIWRVDPNPGVTMGTKEQAMRVVDAVLKNCEIIWEK